MAHSIHISHQNLLAYPTAAVRTVYPVVGPCQPLSVTKAGPVIRSRCAYPGSEWLGDGIANARITSRYRHHHVSRHGRQLLLRFRDHRRRRRVGTASRFKSRVFRGMGFSPGGSAFEKTLPRWPPGRGPTKSFDSVTGTAGSNSGLQPQISSRIVGFSTSGFSFQRNSPRATLVVGSLTPWTRNSNKSLA